MTDKTPVAVKFYKAERQLTIGPAFVGARFVYADKTEQVGNELCGVGYTRGQALDDLKTAVQKHCAGGFRLLALACIEAAEKIVPVEPVSEMQNWVHENATAFYHGNRQSRRAQKQSRKRNRGTA